MSSTSKKLYLSTRDLCERFGVSHMWIERRMKDSAFPRPVKMGRLRFYKIADVEAWERKQAKASAA